MFWSESGGQALCMQKFHAKRIMFGNGLTTGENMQVQSQLELAGRQDESELTKGRHCNCAKLAGECAWHIDTGMLCNLQIRRQFRLKQTQWYHPLRLTLVPALSFFIRHEA